MHLLRQTCCYLSGLAVVVVLSTSVSPASAEEGEWIDLIAKGDLEKHWVTEGNWILDDEGVVTLKPREGEKGWTRYLSYLWLNEEPMADFEFEFDYMLETRGNSGFYFRVGEKKNATKNGIEVQIYDTPSRGGKKKLGDHDSGGVIKGMPPSKNACKPAGEWNSFHITLKGEDLTVVLNGEVVNQFNINESGVNDGAAKGYIGFQDHGMPMKLRKLRMKRL